MRNNNFYITTAISYVNGKPHLGHVYEMISSDFLARFQRMVGKNVFFLTGTDEHGQKIQKAAEEHNIPPQEFCDQNAKAFKDIARTFSISYDRFIRTTEEDHKKAVHALWKKLEEKGDIYESIYEGWYSQRDEAFFTEDELVTKEDGKKYTAGGAPVVWVKEPSYFFRLSRYTDKLLALYEEKDDFISPKTRCNEIVSFVKGGLKDLSISRSSFDWGIKVPSNPDHVVYVWLDALTNYLSALGYPNETKEMTNFWPCNLHIIGKDVIRFHAIFWPAFLMSAEIPLPHKVFGHGFININGEKMSKSLGNVISPQDLIEQFDTDSLRYFLLRDISYGEDGSFSYEGAVARINADLANDFGNLMQRTFSMVYKNCDGIIPSKNDESKDDKELYHKVSECLKSCTRLADECKIHRMLEEVWKIVSLCNRYVDEQAPWTLKKEDMPRFEAVMHVLCDMIRMIALLSYPAIPQKASLVLDYLSIPSEERNFDALLKPMKERIKIEKPTPFFPRIEAQN